MLAVILDILQGLCFSLVLGSCWEGLSPSLSLGPKQEPLRFAQLLSRTHSPSTSAHSHILSHPSSQSLSWHLEFIRLPKMHLEPQEYVLGERVHQDLLWSFFFFFFERISLNHGFSNPSARGNCSGKMHSSSKMLCSTRILTMLSFVLFFFFSRKQWKHRAKKYNNTHNFLKAAVLCSTPFYLQSLLPTFK